MANSQDFKIQSPFKPTGDQPQAIAQLTTGILSGEKFQTLLGVTGSGKTFTMANVIVNTKKPTLIISHNKTLAAQLYQEFKTFFPENSIHYFVSYYDYYQPEAYMPTTDTYIEKDAKVNEQLDRLRHEATQAILSRSDVIVIASVSCIYNIGSPENYEQMSIDISADQDIAPKKIAEQLMKLQFVRNDIEKTPGTFNQRGETLEVYPSSGNEFYQLEFNLHGNKIKNILSKSLNIGDREKSKSLMEIKIFPAKFWTSPEEKINLAITNIKKELAGQLKKLKRQKKVLEYARLEQRVNFDLEMLLQAGYCYGVENYSSHLEFRDAGSPPFTLIDYFKHAYGDDFMTIIDESHMTVPQVRAMFNGDQARKSTLINYGFRLPSALDNRPLKFDEFEDKITQTVFVSATPSLYEIEHSQEKNVAQQIIRPTGLLDPEIEIRPTKNQIPDLIKEIRIRVAKKQKVFVTVLTKRLAEEMAEYLADNDLKAYYLHSEIKTLERTEILRDLRLDKYDIIVGVNLLREGIDIPEISFIAIMDADKEGFLRNKTTLIQTIGRAARNTEGKVIMYADRITQSMSGAIEETNRRREIQRQYNQERGLTPQALNKPIHDLIISNEKDDYEKRISEIISDENMVDELLKEEPKKAIKVLEKEMKKAAGEMNFDLATKLRDRIKDIRKWM